MYNAIKVIGGCYLVYMGMKTIWHAMRQPASFANNNNFSGYNLEAFQKGLFTSFSNPKTAAFFGSLFISTFPIQAPIWINIAAVFIVIVISISWYCIIACFFSFNKITAFYKKAKRPLDIMTGSLLSHLGLRLVLAEN